MSIKNKFFAFFSLPLLVLIVACIQIYNTETTNLSRWKGGGFGMYTNINEVYNIIVINDSVFSDKYFATSDENLSNKLKKRLLYNTNNKNLEAFLNALKNKETISQVKIFKPTLNPQTNSFTYQLYYEKNIK
ncbi:MAG: hypothetical protein R6V37_08730 [Psychroflexus maritimus]